LKRATHQTIKEKRKAQLDARMEMIRVKRQKRSSKTETTSIQQIENKITSAKPDITKTVNTSPPSPKTSVTATEEETASRIVQKPSNNIDTSNLLSNPEQAVNDLLSNIRRQIEQKRNGKVEVKS